MYEPSLTPLHLVIRNDACYSPVSNMPIASANMTTILHNQRFIWIIFIVSALVTFITYLLTSLDAGQGNLLMPLDDVYIHFQYARQMALGHPYQYNLIDPPTSGATSLIYPYVLAFGYFIGFQGLWLGLWAMLLGTVALIVSQWAVYRLCKVLAVPQWLSLLTAIVFGLTGSITWHFMSGMETGLVITLTLLTLLFLIEKRLIPFLVVSAALTLTRPEGGLIAALAAVTLFLRCWQEYGADEKRPARRKYLLLLAIPVLAIGIQPILNLMITGTTVATGTQAKSILSTVPQDYGLIFSRIWDNFTRMWAEFVTGYDGHEGRGWYLPIFTGFIGLLAIPLLITKKDYRLVGFMLFAWLLILTGVISTLDNAFWHFKRYQMPMLALFFPLSAWVIADTLQRFPKFRAVVYAYTGIVLPIFAIVLFAQFRHYHAMNVSYVHQQPFQMAVWLRENTPDEALVAVHDVGLMRYLGERNTLDIVGLTTHGAAVYWRNGPGSVAEFLINEQPDYIASYGRGHGYGLALLADTALYANQLADFTITDWQPHLNVALAADSQGIYQPDWTYLQFATGSVYSSYVNIEPPYLAEIDVGDLISESQYQYTWNASHNLGFATEVQQFGEIDSYRLIDDYESFTLLFEEPEEYPPILITRAHALYAGTIEIFINDEFVDRQWIPSGRGQWLDLNTEIPLEFLNDVPINVRIVPNINDGFYAPSHHILARQNIHSTRRPDIQTGENPASMNLIATFQEESFALEAFNIQQIQQDQIDISLDYIVSAQRATGDYRFFAHLYDNSDEPPIGQWDGYVQSYPEFNIIGMPVGNWLAGSLHDAVIIDIDSIPPGTYQLAIGFYNPNDPTDRLVPESDVYEVTPDGRLWLGTVEIE